MTVRTKRTNSGAAPPRTSRQPVRRRGRPADARKHADILAVAMDVFLERGFHAASMDAIAERAEVSKITVYAHFSSKQALFSAIIAELAGRLTGTIQRLTLAGLPPAQALRQVARAYLDLALAPRSLALHRLVVAEAVRHPQLGKLIFRNGPKAIVDTLAEYLRVQSALRIANPELAAQQFLGMVLAQNQLGLLLAARPATKTAVALDDMIDHAVELFLHGCRNDREPADKKGRGLIGRRTARP
ncbi:MAG: TetR/AcrR family transcriptional regulator [Ferrovibrio sp.]|uniref:TetR/AcrR family transcriptional regulator n=1 Tax=Ferrovibrio sp. TaxID=1917215 RepID=UPI0026019DF5|nr:TetR/AcrR family transcriptional regulator [Ferrovibrio sp.]MCW0234200.1 TetR/AcrR family transcriptional regulator [Ferrovibrio sp.]